MRPRTERRPAPLPGCHPADAPPPAPLPSRPVQWRRAFGLLRQLRRDPGRTDRAFEMFEAAGGRGDDDLFRRFMVSAEGRALFAGGSCLASVLADRERLAGLPEGSLGRAYLAFAREHGFAADGLLRTRDQVFDGFDDDIGPERQWFFDRLTVMHDLWHVLTGYATSGDGEIWLLAFSRAQGMRSRATAAFIAMGALLGGGAVRRVLREAWWRGRRSACLVVQPWEELLPLPLDEVRARLRIPPLERAHPSGLPAPVPGSFLGAAV